ncbi:hypothetical protein [Roseicella aquatilis]|uniref:Uncharacterized protein n=1 Tax=Roseicella aquatilis TaxID=2527868 RepID=A0A4R4D3W7_9PROT|nr:hypothetical protein [Roseicella aquatilis]TCZ53621.1 hypothetical protein EXY23_24595 [Roseicella aquatilis]
MAWTIDARLPLLVVGSEAALAAALAEGPKAAVLAEALLPSLPTGAVVLASFDARMPHAAACACCGGRSPAATALDRLFQARVRSRCPWFERVVALAGTEAARAAIAAALREDAVTAARFRAA